MLAIGAVLLIGYELIRHWNTVKQVASEVWNAVTSAVSTMTSQVGGLINTLIGWFVNAASWLVSAGYNVVVGLWNGIASGWSWLEGKVSSLAASLLSAAKSALGISSPSRLFADEVGAWIGPGIAQGVENNAATAVHAATQLAQRVTTAAQLGAFDGGSLGLSSTPGGGWLSATLAGSGTAPNVTVHVHVAGSVLAENDLARVVQQGLLRHSIRNSSPGVSYVFG